MTSERIRVEAPQPLETLGLDHIRRVGGCSRPVQLTGQGNKVSQTTGEIMSPWSTNQIPGGVAYVPCKTRHKSRCESCAWLYQGDAYQLIVAGLRGGKDTPDAVSGHPALFVTLTAPSFGKVHSQRRDEKRQNQVNICHRGDAEKTCIHGNKTACFIRHSDNDHKLGTPLCTRCFDYETAVLWNNSCSELWRRTRIQLDRAIANMLRVPRSKLTDHLRTQYVKVAEFQKRGLVHFHIAMRVDGPTPEDEAPISELQLRQAIETSIKQVKVRLSNGKRARWGTQFKLIAITPDEESPDENPRRLSRGQVAGYLGKYATKAADGDSALDRRIYDKDQIALLKVNSHLRQLVKTAWNLSLHEPELRTDAWAHQLGYRGHFMTKSRMWSTTFKALRQVRTDYQTELRQQSWNGLSHNALTVIHAKWSYAGIGYLRQEDTWIAQQLSARRTRKEAA